MTSVAMVFDRPVGIHGDIAEMEFVTALLQSSQTFLRNRVTAEDVTIYLRSRHGVVVTEEVRELLIQELAGGTCDKPDHDSIDPCQLVAMLLIPQFLHALKGGHEDTTRVFQAFQDGIGSGKQVQMDVQTLRKILQQNGEHNVSDSVLREMVATLNDNEGDLVKTLTHDLVSFIIGWEERNTTHFEDALGSLAPKKNIRSEQALPAYDESKGNEKTLTTVSTASFIDYTADNFRRPVFHAILLGCGIATYFSYVLNVEHEWVNCDTSKVPCQVGSGLVKWLSVFLQLVVLGLPFILLGSLGNSVLSINPVAYVARALVAIVTIGMFTIYPFSTSMSTAFFYTEGNKDLSTIGEFCAENADYDNCVDVCTANVSLCDLGYDMKTDPYGAAYWLSLILGYVLISILIVDLAYFFIPKTWLQHAPVLRSLVTPGGFRLEAAAKKAASYRMSRLLGNALNLQPNQIGNNTEKAVLRALKRMRPGASIMERFQMLPKVTEEAGGVFWVWRRIFNGTLFSEEGVWITGRVLACNFSQLMVVGMVIFFAVYWENKQGDFLYTKKEDEISNTVATVQSSLDENPTFRTQAFVEELGTFTSCVYRTWNIAFPELSFDWSEDWTEDYTLAGSRIWERCMLPMHRVT